MHVDFLFNFNGCNRYTLYHAYLNIINQIVLSQGQTKNQLWQQDTKLDDYLQTYFPDSIERLNRIRKSDHILNEICKDFEDIAALKMKWKASTSQPIENDMTDLDHTLNALQLEIQQYLIDKH